MTRKKRTMEPYAREQLAAELARIGRFDAGEVKRVYVALVVHRADVYGEKRLDANETMVLQNQLEYLRARTADIRRPEFKARLLVPITSEVDPGAETWAYAQWDRVGMAKIVANLLAFTTLWLALAAGVLGTIASARIFGGFIPFGVASALAPFVSFCLILAVAIVVESEFWAVVTQGACNVSYSFWWLVMIRYPSLRDELRSPVAIWSAPILTILAVEVALIVAAAGLTF